MYILPKRFKSEGVNRSKSTRKHPEQTLQIQVATFLHWALPPDVPWTAIGHGGGGKLRGMILKAMGLQPGWPDIHLIINRRAAYIELKSVTGTLSDAQKQVRDAILQAGGIIATCRSVDEVGTFLEGLAVPLRARLMPAERAVLTSRSARKSRRSALDDEVPPLL